jgi:putative membrane protein
VGTANVIPGVSGGTIALITGIFERLIHSIKSFNGHAFSLLTRGKTREFVTYTDLRFLILILSGVAVAIISAARILEYLFADYPVFVWSFFFGLIMVSIYYVGRTITSRGWKVWVAGTIGAILAIGITLITPASQNENFFYVMMCGAVAMCSMILPGLSGSFVLIMMGNYQLIFIDAVNDLRLEILIPFAIGAAVGLLAFSHLLSWVFKKFRNVTLALLTGFIAGSLGILWPWKEPVFQTFGDKNKVVGYTWEIPSPDLNLVVSIALMLTGIFLIVAMEQRATKHSEEQ